ncbi:hypothetical protein M3Y99_00733400 [Aphelenchoides fujianensis]|nr:hypothetical protein M3Y99_00733400 [Aphelenchoides fujianensis]
MLFYPSFSSSTRAASRAADCGRRLEAADHFHEAAGGRIVCLRCYAAHSAPRCSGGPPFLIVPSTVLLSVCFAGIVDECVRAGDGFFHSACFVCPDCKQPLKGRRRLLKFVADSKQKTR